MFCYKVRVIRLLFVGLLACCNGAQASAPTDQGMSLTWVGQEVSHNGFPMSILHFSSDKSVEQTLDFYRSVWREPVAKDSPGFIENSVGQWQVISRLKGASSWVVQVQPGAGGGSEGFISDMNLGASVAIPPRANDFPKMEGSTLVSHTSALDGGVADGLTLVIKNTYSVEQNAKFYTQRLSAKGLNLSHKKSTADTATLFFVGRGEKMDVAVGESEDGGSVIFANIIDNE